MARPDIPRVHVLLGGPFINYVTRDKGGCGAVNFRWFSSVTRLKVHYLFLQTSVTKEGGGRGVNFRERLHALHTTKATDTDR